MSSRILTRVTNITWKMFSVGWFCLLNYNIVKSLSELLSGKSSTKKRPNTPIIEYKPSTRAISNKLTLYIPDFRIGMFCRYFAQFKIIVSIAFKSRMKSALSGLMHN